MKKVLSRICAVFLAITMLMSTAPMSVFALSSQEQEDIYRVDTWWQDEYNQQYIDWLLESDNFLYHLDITTGNIIHDVSYESLNINPSERKVSFIFEVIRGIRMKNIKISVIMPVFNREKFLEESIGSVLAQSYENFEIILIDDGSTDKTLDICDSLVAKEPRIRFFATEHIGVSHRFVYRRGLLFYL